MAGRIRKRTLCGLAVVVGLAGCGGGGPRDLPWDVRFEPSSLGTRAAVLEASILEGGCAGSDVWRDSVPVTGGGGMQPPRLSPGTYGFSISAVDSGCVAFASGCSEVELPLPREERVTVTLRVLMSEIPLCGPEICVGGRCTLPRDAGADAAPMCPTGRADCNVDTADGCETDVTTVEDCGGCGVSCRLDHATPACSEGLCTIAECDADWADCDGNDANGCETSTVTLTDCGTCGNRCNLPHADEACEGGRCVIQSCHPGWDNCDTTVANGCEADLTDPATCGDCTTACASGTPLCGVSGGRRACLAACTAEAASLCGSSCVNTVADSRHCGGCDRVCDPPNAIPACTGGLCSIGSCEEGWASCDASTATGCERSTTTLDDCGGCGTPCHADRAVTSCEDGTCEIDLCLEDTADCDDEVSTGCEADLAAATSCGSCEMSCAGGTPLCGVLPGGDRMCVGECGEPAPEPCGDRCLDVSSDIMNCGGCGLVCSLDGATERCFDGGCRVAACDPGRGNCDGLDANGCEEDVTSDPENCGACGEQCMPPDHMTGSCMAGECVFTCEPGFGDCDSDMGNGCEERLNTATHCGRCDQPCSLLNAESSCASGTCELVSCNPPFDNCDGLAGNGCESNLDTDPSHCGMCTTICTGMTRNCCSGTCCR